MADKVLDAGSAWTACKASIREEYHTAEELTWVDEDRALLLLASGRIPYDSNVRCTYALVRPVERYVKVTALQRVTEVTESRIPVGARGPVDSRVRRSGASRSQQGKGKGDAQMSGVGCLRHGGVEYSDEVCTSATQDRLSLYARRATGQNIPQSDSPNIVAPIGCCEGCI